MATSEIEKEISYMRGFITARREAGVNVNPYREGTREYDLWIIGYNEGTDYYMQRPGLFTGRR